MNDVDPATNAARVIYIRRTELQSLEILCVLFNVCVITYRTVLISGKEFVYILFLFKVV